MPVPTIASVTPNTGHTGGRNVVVLAGTNFRLPPAPPATGKTSGVVPKTVKVTLGGVEATDVRVFSATELDCRPGIHDPGAVAVVVQNLDDNGAPIAGESATLANGYTYQRPDLTVESDLVRVIRVLRRELARQVTAEVAITTHADFDALTADGLQLIEVAKLPALILNRFRLTNNRSFNQFLLGLQALDPVGGVVRLAQPAEVMDLTLQIGAVTDMTVELLNLEQSVIHFFKKNKSLFVPDDLSNPASRVLEFEMEYFRAGEEVARIAPRRDNANAGVGLGTAVIRGIPFDGFPGLTDDAIVERTFTAEDIVIEVQRKG